MPIYLLWLLWKPGMNNSDVYIYMTDVYIWADKINLAAYSDLASSQHSL